MYFQGRFLTTDYFDSQTNKYCIVVLKIKKSFASLRLAGNLSELIPGGEIYRDCRHTRRFNRMLICDFL
jgi:hypothetical protein